MNTKAMGDRGTDTPDLEFDEVACRQHGKDVEEHADVVLGASGRRLMHVSGSSRLRRGKPYLEVKT